MALPTGLIINGNAVKNDGGTIFASPGTTFGTSRFDEFTEGVGVGVGVNTLPKSGLATIDVINAQGTYLQPGDVIAKVTTDLASVSNTTMQKMDKGQHLQEFKRDSLSGVAVATAVRNNQWSDVSGVFTTAPSTFNSAWGTDFSAVPTGGITSSPGNKFRFMTGRKNPSGVQYPGKTVW